MNINEYQLVCEVQTDHWWWIGRRKILETIIEKYLDTSKKLNIADVGAGFGANVSMLRQYGDVTALELNKDAITHMDKKWGKSVKTVIWKSPEHVEEQFDLILLADVLEHIPDDREAVAWIWEHLAPGGYALLTAPAHDFLWSDMDDVVSHFRRYNLRQFIELFSAPFELVYISYYNFLLFPIKCIFVILTSLRRKLFPKSIKRSFNDKPPWLINTVFKYVLYLEAKQIKRTKMPYGVALVCLVRKPN